MVVHQQERSASAGTPGQRDRHGNNGGSLERSMGHHRPRVESRARRPLNIFAPKIQSARPMTMCNPFGTLVCGSLTAGAIYSGTEIKTDVWRKFTPVDKTNYNLYNICTLKRAIARQTLR